MKKRLLLPFLITIFSIDDYAATKFINLNFFKPFFDSLSIDEIEKEAKDKPQNNSDEDDNDENQSQDLVKIIPNNTNISKYFVPLVFTGNIGPLWENAGQTQTFFLAPKVKKTYAAAKTTNVITTLSLFWGVQKSLATDLFTHFGVTVATASNAVLTGEIWDDGYPKFNNFTYQYSVKATRVAAKGILFYDIKLPAVPWLSASLGISYNNFYNFINSPKIFEAVTNFNFKHYTSTAFTYNFGAGLQKKIDNHWSLGLGYDFTDWGHGRLSKSFYQANFNAIKMQHYYTNGFVFNITYIS